MEDFVDALLALPWPQRHVTGAVRKQDDGKYAALAGCQYMAHVLTLPPFDTEQEANAACYQMLRDLSDCLKARGCTSVQEIAQ